MAVNEELTVGLGFEANLGALRNTLNEIGQAIERSAATSSSSAGPLDGWAQSMLDTEEAIEEARESLKGLEDDADNTTASFDTLHTAVVRLAGAMAGIFAISRFKNAAAQTEQLRRNWRLLTGSMVESRKVLEGLRRIEMNSPFDRPELEAAAQTLLRAGMATQNIADNLEVMADLAADTGANITEVAALFAALQSSGQAINSSITASLESMGMLPTVAQKLFPEIDGAVHAMQRFRVAAAMGGIQTRDVIVTLQAMGVEAQRSAEIAGRSFLSESRKMGRTLQDLFASIGLKLLPIFQAINLAVRGLVDGFMAADKALGGTLTAAAATLAIMVTLVPMVLTAAAGYKAIAFSLSSIPAILVKIAAAQTLTGWGAIFTLVGAILFALIKIGGWLTSNARITDRWAQKWPIIWTAIQRIWSGFAEIFKILVPVTRLFELFGIDISAIFSNLATIFEDLVLLIIEGLTQIATFYAFVVQKYLQGAELLRNVFAIGFAFWMDMFSGNFNVLVVLIRETFEYLISQTVNLFMAFAQASSGNFAGAVVTLANAASSQRADLEELLAGTNTGEAIANANQAWDNLLSGSMGATFEELKEQAGLMAGAADDNAGALDSISAALRSLEGFSGFTDLNKKMQEAILQLEGRNAQAQMIDLMGASNRTQAGVLDASRQIAANTAGMAAPPTAQ